MSKLNQRVCVFGATGFIGSSICAALENQGIDWAGISRTFKSDKVLQIDIKNIDKLSKIIADYPIVINAMGVFKPIDFETNTKVVFDAFWNDLNDFCNVLSNSPVAKLVHISSAGTVYGDTQGVPAHENCELKPISWYGKSKVIEETFFKQLAQVKAFKYACVRVANPYGNNQISNHGFIDVLLSSLNSNRSFNTFSSTSYSRDFIHCDDMAERIVAIINYEQPNLIDYFNVGTGQSTSLHHVLNLVKSLRSDFSFKTDKLPTSFDVVQSVLDVSKLAKLNPEYNNCIELSDYLKKKLTI